MKRIPEPDKGDLRQNKDSQANEQNGGAPGSQEKTTVQGRVEMLGDFPKNIIAPDNGKPHSGAVLRTAQGRLVVHLGPPGFFQRHDFPIRAGDVLEVQGSTMVTSARQPILLATEVRRNGKRLKIRNERGLPLWG